MNPTDFESLTFNSFDTQNTILMDNLSDPDINFYNKNNLEHLDTPYLNSEEVNDRFQTIDDNDFSVLHINIRSMAANFEKLKNFLYQCKHTFSIISITETWCTNENLINNSNFQLPNYQPISFERKTRKRGGGIINFIHKEIMFKMRDDLSVSDADNEVLTIEIINQNCKNIFIAKQKNFQIISSTFLTKFQTVIKNYT